MVSGHQLTDGDQLNLTLTGGQEKLLTEKGYQGKKVILGIRPEDISADLIVEDTFLVMWSMRKLSCQSCWVVTQCSTVRWAAKSFQPR